jgi:predicted AAA+ superfamily ATPase
VLARDDRDSVRWREDFIRSFLERDIPLLGISIPPHALRRFWIMISHYHGQLLNLSELARSFGVSDHTVRRYLEILSGTYMIRLVPPWHANVGKRLVRAPKLYVRDSGLFHTLQTIEDASQLEAGASWEGFALEQVIRLLGIRDPYFWRTHTGAELDLLWLAGGKTWGMELKYADAPSLSRSLHSVLEDLSPEHLWVLYPGKEEYRLHERITVLPLASLPEYAFPRDATGRR